VTPVVELGCQERLICDEDAAVAVTPLGGAGLDGGVVVPPPLPEPARVNWMEARDCCLRGLAGLAS